MSEAVRKGEATAEEVTRYLQQLTVRHLLGTAQAFVVTKPHGYYGNFEIIDIIYRQHIVNEPHLQRWDHYFHNQSAPKAVRNRKAFFHALLDEMVARHPGETVHILNVASGPGRDMQEWLASRPDSPVFFDCVELDANAINYAQNLCKPFSGRVRFHHANALRFQTSTKYHLIWAAGLFDYLTDSLFVRLLRRLCQFVRPGGEIVIGNFGSDNPTRNYMELLGGWKLTHRSRDELHVLALAAGAKAENVKICHEVERVNLFLRIRLPLTIQDSF